MQHLADVVRENNCDFGIGIDGDGDQASLMKKEILSIQIRC